MSEGREVRVVCLKRKGTILDRKRDGAARGVDREVHRPGPDVPRVPKRRPPCLRARRGRHRNLRRRERELRERLIRYAHDSPGRLCEDSVRIVEVGRELDGCAARENLESVRSCQHDAKFVVDVAAWTSVVEVTADRCVDGSYAVTSVWAQTGIMASASPPALLSEARRERPRQRRPTLSKGRCGRLRRNRPVVPF